MPRKVKMRVHAGRPVPMHVTGAPALAMAVRGGGGSALPAYPGPYEATPQRRGAVVLPTAGKRMTADVVLNEIPRNYGLIEWNGSVLTVS